jgi:hypothetical protein
MPLVLLALDTQASLSSAMARGLAVLMVSGLIWARGLGPRGALADRLFVSVWVGSWAAALGALVTSGSWSTSTAGSAALLATLFVGAGWLGWAFHERQQLVAVSATEIRQDPSHTGPAKPATIAAAWLLASGTLALLIWSKSAHWSDSVVVLLALASFTAFQMGPAVEDEPTD